MNRFVENTVQQEDIRRYYEAVVAAPEKTAEQILEALEETINEVV